jgi:sulfatase maturation enzyme AslB (radical SAM superfamily)
MDVNELITEIINVHPNRDDLIVLNGGEPTIHPSFYKLIAKLQDVVPSEIAIYSNGISIKTKEMRKSDKTFLIIPIHGLESTHDKITQTPKSFIHTLENIHNLDLNGYRYRIKFIINESMINSNFNFYDFLIAYHLNPEEVIIARLNETKKSKRNQVRLPSNGQLRLYIQHQVNSLKNLFRLKFLDIPPCWLNDCNFINSTYNVPDFYFTDPNNKMKNRSYYKDVMIGKNCIGCKHYVHCKTMSNSYLTLSLYNNEYILERE